MPSFYARCSCGCKKKAEVGGKFEKKKKKLIKVCVFLSHKSSTDYSDFSFEAPKGFFFLHGCGTLLSYTNPPSSFLLLKAVSEKKKKNRSNIAKNSHNPIQPFLQFHTQWGGVEWWETGRRRVWFLHKHMRYYSPSLKRNQRLTIDLYSQTVCQQREDWCERTFN